ncbi:MAG TPA: hypothetical protein VGC42_18280 [Kofleriaceae bacterium]
MKFGHVLVLLLATAAGCVTPQVDVKPLAPAPRAMSPRDVAALKTFESRPDGAVAVYDLDAYGDVPAKLDAVARQKAASLGCDGVMLLVRKEAINADNDATTGQLNEHHTKPGSHVQLLCIVTPEAAK